MNKKATREPHSSFLEKETINWFSSVAEIRRSSLPSFLVKPFFALLNPYWILPERGENEFTGSLNFNISSSSSEDFALSQGFL